MPFSPRPIALLLACAGPLAACGGGGGDDDLNVLPAAVVPGSVQSRSYDGNGDDLLTAGLGKSGLASATPPTIVDAANPSAAELRRRAIYNNYRALVDVSAGGGYGSLYGPNVDLTGKPSLGEGKIAGEEWLAYADDGSGRRNVTLMVQIPAHFNPGAPCIVTATSSGSRGVYGAIGAAGEWGLKRGCAVAYNDKGSGNGFHDLDTDKVTLIDGRLADASSAGKNAHFNAGLTPAELAAFKVATPHRFAFKHAHSQQNPERNWGEFTLNAIEFAFYALNEKYGDPRGDKGKVRLIKPDNTVVIAASVSNGAGAALAAAEQDANGLIDGVVATEPQVQVALGSLAITRGGQPVAAAGKGLYDYFTIGNLYQPCAATAASLAGSPMLVMVNAERGAARCTALKNAGLLDGDTPAAQAEAALAKLRAAGWEADSDLLHASHYGLNATLGVTMAYANAYSRASVKDHVCGYSYGATAATGEPVAAAAAAVAGLFGAGNGVPPTGGVNIIANEAKEGPIVDAMATSKGSGLQDYNSDGALCLRTLFTGNLPPVEPTPTLTAQSAALLKGVGEVKRSARLNGKPTIMLHGRSDALVPVNHGSRAYYALNRATDGGNETVYYEVTNAQHFDAFNALAGYDTRFIPLHYYAGQALNLMYARLTKGDALPPAQVVRTVPRGGSPGAAPAITAGNVPAIASNPPNADRIVFSASTLAVPE